MTTSTEAIFDPKVYIEQLKRCDIETIAHLESALNQDCDVQELTMLCRYYHTDAGGIVHKIAAELGIVPKRKKVV